MHSAIEGELCRYSRFFGAHEDKNPFSSPRFLQLVFGAVYFCTPSDDIAGITGKISVIFLCVAFGSIICYMTPLAILERERPMVYRERHSCMYDSVAYSLAMAIVEVPWTAFISLWTCTILYFMVGLKADAATFWHFVLVH